MLTSGDGVGVGKIYHYVNGKIHFHQRVYNIHNFKKNVLGKYFYEYFSHNFYNRVMRMSAKGSVDSVRLDMIAKMSVLIPTIEEQKKITDILASVNQKIDLINKKIKYTQELKKGLVQKLFSKGIGVLGADKQWRSHTKYRDSIFGQVPNDWKVCEVKDITLEHKQGYYTKDSYSSSGTKLIRITDLSNPSLHWEQMPKLQVSEKDVESFSVAVGDFLFARSGAIGRYGIVERSESAIFASYLIRFRFNEDLVDPYFFGIFYESYLAQNQIIARSQGNANININAENIKTIRLPLPPISEQKEMMKIFGSVDKKLSCLERQKVETQQLKKGLMQKLLSGKWRINFDKAVNEVTVDA